MSPSESDESDEFHLHGSPVSEGIAIGEPYFLSSGKEEIPEFPIDLDQIEKEVARYRRALFLSREDLQELQRKLEGEGADEALSIIAAHIQMLDDPMITTNMEAKIRQMRRNTESVFHGVIEEYKKRFSAVRDSFFQQRLIDVIDLSLRILGHLRPQRKDAFEEAPPNAVVFAKEITPTATAAASRIAAFVTERGGGHSHAALIARSKGIPFVASIDLELLQSAQGKQVIVDGLTGDVIVNPRPETLIKYQELQQLLKKHYQLLEKEVHLPAETIEGKKITFFANIGSLSDLDLAARYHVDGIGLFRSEYLLTQDPLFLDSEEKQREAYVEAVQKMGGAPVVIRLFDLGGDKYPELIFGRERGFNPALGYRGIRFLLRRKHILKTQLRALLYAAREANIQILVPFVSELKELRAVKGYAAEVAEELRAKGEKGIAIPPIGSMIELPGAVFLGDALAEESAFLSIGTNDLIQYSLGIDRSNPEIDTALLQLHPSILQMIQRTLLAGRKAHKPVSLCGEMATHSTLLPLLIGLGVEEFSCAPRFIPILKQIVRNTSLEKAKNLAEEALRLHEPQEIQELLSRESGPKDSDLKHQPER